MKSSKEKLCFSRNYSKVIIGLVYRSSTTLTKLYKRLKEGLMFPIFYPIVILQKNGYGLLVIIEVDTCNWMLLKITYFIVHNLQGSRFSLSLLKYFDSDIAFQNNLLGSKSEELLLIRILFVIVSVV